MCLFGKESLTTGRRKRIMAPAIRAPNRAESLAFPVFSLTWYGVPASPRGDGVSLLAYCGGGGSAKVR